MCVGLLLLPRVLKRIRIGVTIQRYHSRDKWPMFRPVRLVGRLYLNWKSTLLGASPGVLLGSDFQ